MIVELLAVLLALATLIGALNGCSSPAPGCSRSSSRWRPGRSGAASPSRSSRWRAETPAPGLISAVLGSIFGVPKSVIVVALLFLLWFWLQPDPLHHRPHGDRQRRGPGAAARRPRRPAEDRGVRLLGRVRGARLDLGHGADGGGRAERRRPVHPQLGRSRCARWHEHLRRERAPPRARSLGAIAFLMIPDLVFALNLTSFWSIFFQGLILILAVTLNSVIQTRARARRDRRPSSSCAGTARSSLPSSSPASSSSPGRSSRPTSPATTMSARS